MQIIALNLVLRSLLKQPVVCKNIFTGGDGVIYPRHEFDMGGYPPHQLEFFENLFSGFEN
jgi:hypothetical protein